MPSDNDLLRRLEAIVGADRLFVGSEKYSRDESDVGPRTPTAAVEVLETAEIQAIVRLARELSVPVIARGAGTGKAGGALAERGGVVVSTARMNRIVEISSDDHVAVVQP